MPWCLLFIHSLSIIIMQQQGINTFTYDNLRSFPSNAFQLHHLGNGAMLHPMQQYPHIPFVQQQYAAHHYAAVAPFVQQQHAAHNFGAGAPSTWNVHGATSGCKSFVVYLNPEEEATYLRRAKNLGVASKQCRELTQQIVQDVNLHIANKKKMSSQRFLRGDTTWEQQSKDISNAAAKGSAAAVAAAGGSRSGGIPEVAPKSGHRQRRPWGRVGDSERKRRALIATEPFRSVFWPGFRAAIAAFDEDGAPIGDNELFAILFDYGVRNANKDHRLARGLSFPECLPDGFVASIEVQGRDKLLKQQLRQRRVEAVDEWVAAKSMITDASWNVVRGILPKHVMPSLYQMGGWKKISMRRYGELITYHKTHSGYQASLRTLMPLVFMSNLLKYANGPDAKLRDGVYILIKTMMDGCNVQHINARNLIMAHANIAFLPLDREVLLTDLYDTDEAQRANNLAGQRGISTVTMGLCLGKESYGNVRANLNGNDPEVTAGLLKLETLLEDMHVPRLHELCDAHGIWRGSNSRKQHLVASLRGYIDRNRAELIALASPDAQELEQDCWTNLQKKVLEGDDMFSVLKDYEGAAYTAHLPVMVAVGDGSEPTKLVHARGADGRVLFRVVRGWLGSTFNVDMKMRDLMVRFGPKACGDGCCSAVWIRDRRPRGAAAARLAAAASAASDSEEAEEAAAEADGAEPEPEPPLEGFMDSDSEEEPSAAPGPAVPEAATPLPPRMTRVHPRLPGAAEAAPSATRLVTTIAGRCSS